MSQVKPTGHSDPQFDPNMLTVRGASEHNLKHVDLTLPKGKLIVFTGVSGSGKSSLAFDTIYAEGQRRYVESLSAYARQFLGQMDKPHYDSIRGLSPTISIEQRGASANPRSTVGTITEVYDYLRLLYARAGTPHCHGCGRPTEHTDAAGIVASIMKMGDGAKLLVMAPLARSRKGSFESEFADLRLQGYTRVRVDGETWQLDDVPALDKKKKHDVDVIIDRLVVRSDGAPRLTDSVESALKLGNGRLVVDVVGKDERLYSEHRYCPYCDLSLPELTPQLFSFNSPVGACGRCNGLGSTRIIDMNTLIPDDSQSLNGGCLVPWAESKSPQQQRWATAILSGLSAAYGIDLDAPWKALPADHQNIILNGTGERLIEVTFKGRSGSSVIPMPFEGVAPAIQRQNTEPADGDTRFMRMVACPECSGTRLNPSARAVELGGVTLTTLVSMPIGRLRGHFDALELTGNAAVIAGEVLREVRARLRFLVDVGLTYLTLERSAGTLSGGEAQRIRLASQVGSELTGVLYVLDEPSIGLHPRDNLQLIATLERLRDIGNTVIVVEHDTETMLAADHLVDFGPGAGVLGGTIVAQGTPQEVMACEASLTGGYLSGRLEIPIPTERKRGKRGKGLRIKGATANNLQNVDVAFPLGVFTCVTGVSGAGKSSLVNGILLPALSRALHNSSKPVGAHSKVLGLDQVNRIVAIDQKPIGRTPRSNPATYTKVFDAIRAVFAATRESRVYGYKAGRFSFNIKGGRCEACQGAGLIQIEMHFLADVYVTCEACRGRRFNDATLRVHYKGATIYDVLEMTIEEGLAHFETHQKIKRVLQTLVEVGLGYVALGQSATTLSGGEAQRVKLARELAKRGDGRAVYILDEPSTGLHFEDVRRLLNVTNRLVEGGNTVIMIEHNLDIIKTADHLIDLGPDGGEGGGLVIAEGTPEAVAAAGVGYTAQYLRGTLGC
ncbi:MAG: excinuclease ABC subunit A [Myxococcota bacterium]|jgi:excinuclease ABC subunit A